MDGEIVEHNIEINVLLQHWPDEVAHAFRRFSAEARKKKTALTQEQLEQCAASLERTFPFYKRKFENEPENRLDFTKHFFAGACGFGYKHLIPGAFINRNDIRLLFGDSYISSFDECSREHSDDAEEKTILENVYFGDFVAAFRWLGILFRTVLAGDEDETFSRFRAVLLMGYLMDKENAYKLQQYIQPTLAKEVSNNPELAEDFVQYYLDLDNPDSDECDTDNSDSLYAEVLRQTKQAYRMQYRPEQCAYCHSFYFDGPFNDYESHDKYCSPECHRLHTHWEKQFNTTTDSLVRMRLRERAGSCLLHSNIDDLLENFTLERAIEKYGQLRWGSVLLKLDDYMSNLFIAIEARNDSAYLFRPLLCEFMRCGSDRSSTQKLYQNIVQSIEDHYEKEEIDVRKKKRLIPDDEINKIIENQYFRIY